VNVAVQLVAVLTNGEFLVVVDRDMNLACAVRLIIYIVELRDVWVFQSLLSC